MGAENQVLDDHLVIPFEFRIRGQGLGIDPEDFRLVNDEAVDFGVLFPGGSRFLPLGFRRVMACGPMGRRGGRRFLGFDVWFSLFAFEAVDFIAQGLDFRFQSAVFLSDAFHQIEPMADRGAGGG